VKEYSFKGFGYRLIPSRFPSVEVYRGLVANDRFDALYESEARTNPRLLSKEQLLASYGGEGAPRLQNWNHAPFRYINPEGSRFFPSTLPALDLASDPQTALARAVRRREIFLGRTGEPPIGIDMRMLKTPVAGTFADLTGLPIGISDADCRAEGEKVPSALAGAAFHAPERPKALCLAVTDNGCLGATIQTAHYRFEWDGQRIAKLYAFTEAGEEWEPSILCGGDQVIAA
jgi:RES domain